MRIGIYLVDNISPTIGGNFSYHSKFIQAIDEYTFGNGIEVRFVGRLSKNKVGLRKQYVKLAPYFLYRIFNFLNKLKLTFAFSKLLNINTDLCSRIDGYRLRREGVDIILFPKQFLKEVENFPFITMNWDAGHKTTFAFPELLENFEYRENWYQVEIQKALSIFVESQSSKDEFIKYYRIPDSKIEVIPLFAGGVVDLNVEESQQEKILKDNNLERLNYFYYPAQFWAHKNHYNLILAFKKLKEAGKANSIKLVFSGSDRGNKPYIESIVKLNNLQDSIIVLGFISNETVYTFYKNAIALTMPTFLGPTNMPILEAQALGTPIICSDLTGHRETCLDGALFVNPGDSDAWYEALALVLDKECSDDLAKKAKANLLHSVFKIEIAVRKLEESFLKLDSIRKTFH